MSWYVLVQQEKNGIKNENKAEALHYYSATQALWSVNIF